MANYSPHLPLTLDPITGYKMLDTLKDVVKQNFKMLILTNPGERMMIPDFGIGIYTFLFEQNTPVLYQEIKAKVFSQAKKYLPYVTVQDIQFESLENSQDFDESRSVNISVTYIIKPLNVSDVLTVSVSSSY
jgi:phage baseplate assembly protein W|tara:strand:+ start:515 stop:910 length:396 start_codon:yes stop_codon:yes gene_type:complete